MTNNAKQEGRLSRKRRIRSKVTGTAAKPRLCVYRSIKANYAMLIDDTCGKTLVAASDLKDKAGKNIASAKQIGLRLAEAAKKINIETCVFDRGGWKYHGRVKAIAEGAREGGLKF